MVPELGDAPVEKTSYIVSNVEYEFNFSNLDTCRFIRGFRGATIENLNLSTSHRKVIEK